MKKVIENLVRPEWKSNIENIVRKEYWLKDPHCSDACSVKYVDGTVAYFCSHEVEKN